MLAALLFAPHIAWQIAHGWPTLEFVFVATREKMLPVSPLELFAQQVLVWNPLALPLWLIGIGAMFRPGSDERRSIFGLIFATTAAILIVNGTSRPNYLALAMPPLIAIGAIALQQISLRPHMRWLARTATAVIVIVGLLGAPPTLPILAVPDLLAFSSAIGISAPKMEDRELGSLDPHFADMIGWEQIVDSVADVYHGLSPEDQARAVILAPSYSTAAPIDRLGGERGLPAAISGHNSYWHWGTRGADGSVVVIAGGEHEAWKQHWASVEAVAVWDCGYCLPGRNHGKVFVARDPRAPLQQIWPELRHYD